MTFTEKQKADLAAPLDRQHVATREQSGQKLSYVESWHVIAEANRIFGFDAWTRETVDLRLVSERERKIGRNKDRDGWGVSYLAKVRVTVGDIVREGVGVGHGIDADVGQAHESAAKEAESDAMKRALMTFGNPFGLALYDKSQSNVAATPEATIDDAQFACLQQLLQASQADIKGFCEYYRIPTVSALPASRFDHAKAMLNKKIKEAA